ncbi:MAG: zinc metallopeptidase [Akkermansiaceae bacterium]|nr:zinc metallopeptidase [Akkermansiaceae bacterium]MDP4648004.1 zinc metallopeptidase [Akkermansiaceae bacterium]MDP4781352.1 zinc metallopeptidase [Akkermansiaceae bacterium]
MTTELLQLPQIALIYGFSPTILIIMGATALVSWLVSSTLKRRFNEYSQIPIRFTGAQIAETMLRENGINDVRVISTPGKLTDHYDPTTKTVNLSEAVYGMNSIAAAAVAAHECGHAVQHAKSYAWLAMRSKMVPAVQFASNTMSMLFIAMFFATTFFQSPVFLYAWVGLFAITTLFSIVTLPVEFDASKRALAWLEGSGVSSSMEHEKAKNALFWAAMTYVVAALGSIAMLLYYVSMLFGRRD